MNDERLKKSTDTGRVDRAMLDRAVTQERSFADRISEYRRTNFQNALPNLPEIKGYHTVWVSTSHNTDTIYKRIENGYELIKPEDVPGWEFVSQKSGALEGMINVNEMVAMKLPLELFNAYMEISHHENPLAEEGKMRNDQYEMQEQLRRRGGAKASVESFEGSQEMGRSTARPTEWERGVPENFRHPAP